MECYRVGSIAGRGAGVNFRTLAFLVACCFAGCQKAGVQSSRADLDDYARQYVRLAVALGERDPDALDYYTGPEDQVAGIRRTPPKVEQIKQSADQLIVLLESLHALPGGESERKHFLLGQLHAIAARADLLARIRLSQPTPDFDRESQAFFGVRVTPVPAARMAAVREELAKQLGGGGMLVDRYAAFEQGFLFPRSGCRT